MATCFRDSSAPVLDKTGSVRYYTRVGIKAVGFDLDGTLYPAWMMYAVSVDIGIRHPRLLQAYSAARRIMRTRKFSEAADSTQPFKARQAALIARSLGTDPEIVSKAIDTTIYSIIENRFSYIRPFKGAAACLDSLHKAGLKLGLLSDLPPVKKIGLMGLDGYFESMLCSEDFGALKPDPRPFVALAQALETPPASILYVGNKHEYDVLGAKAAGMQTALVSRRKSGCADFTFHAWDELREWVLLRQPSGSQIE